MAILLDRETKFITCGFTGKQGTFHSIQARDYGALFVGGVTPGKGGIVHEGFPVFNTVSEAVQKTAATAAMISVPPENATDSIIECIEAGIKLIVCITNGFPVADMIKIKSYLDRSDAVLIGPNSPGIITPGESKIGLMPGQIYMPGPVGLVSRSGTLGYDIAQLLTQNELGQSTCLGLGGDLVSGLDFTDTLKLFNEDENTQVVLVVGSAAGTNEIAAAKWAKVHMKKPVVYFMAGTYLDNPSNVQEKVEILKECGIHVVDTIEEIPEHLKSLLSVN